MLLSAGNKQGSYKAEIPIMCMQLVCYIALFAAIM